jgi:hypothetical protein
VSGGHWTERLTKRELANLARDLAREVTIAAQFMYFDDYLLRLREDIAAIRTDSADLGDDMERALRLIEESRERGRHVR